jgi:hypothetical protein
MPASASMQVMSAIATRIGWRATSIATAGDRGRAGEHAQQQVLDHGRGSFGG